MSTKPYNWANPSAPPILHTHSVAKHKILKTYLRHYMESVTSRFQRKKLRLTLVDGFCGGGIYRHEETGRLCPGSPLVLLKAVQQTEAEGRKINPDFTVDAAYYFIDRDPKALTSLQLCLKKRGHNSRMGSAIFLLQGDFAKHYPSLAEIISLRGSHTVFVLDQYGYKDAPVELIKQIIHSFPKAEILLTFAVDAMLNYISNTEQFHSYTRKLEPKGRLLSGSDIKEAKRLKKLSTRRKPGDWRKIISQKLLKRFLKLCGNPQCAPYFIVSRKSNRAYWLLHLSGSQSAKNRMLKLHHSHHNAFGAWEKSTIFGFDPRNSEGSAVRT